MPLRRLGINVQRIIAALRTEEKKPVLSRAIAFAELIPAEKGILNQILAPTLRAGFKKGDRTKLLVIIAGVAALLNPMVSAAIGGGLALQYLLNVGVGLKWELAESLEKRFKIGHIIGVVIDPALEQITVFYEKSQQKPF